MDFIRTPNGKRMTPGRYLALVEATIVRTTGDGPECERGHYSCAAWRRGPCSAEVAAGLDSPTTPTEG